MVFAELQGESQGQRPLCEDQEGTEQLGSGRKTRVPAWEWVRSAQSPPAPVGRQETKSALGCDTEWPAGRTRLGPRLPHAAALAPDPPSPGPRPASESGDGTYLSVDKDTQAPSCLCCPVIGGDICNVLSHTERKRGPGIAGDPRPMGCDA